jgi:citrate lyase beta subunit
MFIVVSNHVLVKASKIVLPKEHVVIRVNVAWVPTKKKLVDILASIKHDIFLDYPLGRTKPPRPKLTLDQVIALIPQFPNIKFFAVSNVENPVAIGKIKARLPKHIELVPKIETRKGVEQLPEIIDSIQTKHIMLDKEDLYVNIHHNQKEFDALVKKARASCKKKGVGVLELQGVVFAHHE